jgi:hypothetical protein
MTQQRVLQVTSLLSVLLFTFHWADEIARGLEPGTIDAAGGFAILFVWLYGTLAIAERRVGLAVILLGALLASGVPILHMTGAGLVGKRIPPNTDGAFFWVWTNIALGACGMITLALSAMRLRQSFSKAGGAVT